MLRITRITEQNAITLKLEGKLTGPWVDELEKSWCSIREPPGDRGRVVDLNDVTFIDRAGEMLLKQMHAAGTMLLAEGPYMTQRLRWITGKKPLS